MVMSESDMVDSPTLIQIFIKAVYDIPIDAFEDGRMSLSIEKCNHYVCKLMQADAWSLLLDTGECVLDFLSWHPVYDKIDGRSCQ